VGVSGTILATDDGGTTWRAQKTDTAGTIAGVCFVNDTIGWAVGEAGSILATTDGGATWRQQTSPSQENLHAVSFAGPQTGWAVGNAGTILATSDGGATWRAIAGGVEDDLLGVWSADPAHIWAVGANGAILSSADGGATWTKRDSQTPFDLHAVRFVDATRGWTAGTNGTLLATEDGGATWQAHDTHGVTAFLSLAQAGAKQIWAAGADGSVLSITAPDTTAVAASEHMPDVQAALRAIDVNADTIGQPMTDFATADEDLAQRTVQVKRERLALAFVPMAAAAPVTTAEQPRVKPALAARFHDPMLLTSVNRIGATIYVLLAALILMAIIRRAMRLTTHLDACADALELNGGATDARFIELVRTLSPWASDPASMVSRK
jgi:photosystem II stability/assembly factor-like uncharacterized protein